jgi:hypothetical protein
MRGPAVEVDPPPGALDERLAAALLERTEELTGVPHLLA